MNSPKNIFLAILLSTALFSTSGCASIFSYLKNKRDKSYEEGITLYESKKYKEAQKKFKDVVSIDPEYKKARDYLNRTTVYVKRQERQQKIEEQKKQKELKRQYNTAVVLKNRKKYEDALDIFVAIQKEDSYFEDIQDQMDECREKLAWKYDQTIEKARKLADKKEYLKAYETAGDAKKYKPDGKEADSVLNDIEKALDKKIKPMKSSAAKLFEQKKYQASRDTLKKALAIKPWDEEIPGLMERCDRMIAIDNQFNDAMSYYRKKDYYTAYLKMLSVNRQESNYRNCESHIETLKALLNRNINNYYSSGLRYYEQNNFQAAINEWNKVLTIDPNHEKARYYRERAAAKLDIQKSLAQ